MDFELSLMVSVSCDVNCERRVVRSEMQRSGSQARRDAAQMFRSRHHISHEDTIGVDHGLSQLAVTTVSDQSARCDYGKRSVSSL